MLVLFIFRHGILFWVIIFWWLWNIMNLVFSAFSESLFTANQSEILVNSELIKFEILEFPPCVKEQMGLVRVVSSAQSIKFKLLLTMWGVGGAVRFLVVGTIGQGERPPRDGVSSGWSSVWHRSNTGLSSTQYEQIPIILGVWPFWLTPFYFRSITFWRAYG